MLRTMSRTGTALYDHLPAMLFGNNANTDSRNGYSKSYKRGTMLQRNGLYCNNDFNQRGNSMTTTIADIIMATFACTAANHLGLVAAAEGIIKHRLHIINCPKCFTFWTVTTLCILGGWNIIVAAAAALAAAYIAIWMTLAMGMIDKIYNNIYDTYFTEPKNKKNSDTNHKDYSEFFMS